MANPFAEEWGNNCNAGKDAGGPDQPGGNRGWQDGRRWSEFDTGDAKARKGESTKNCNCFVNSMEGQIPLDS